MDKGLGFVLVVMARLWKSQIHDGAEQVVADAILAAPFVQESDPAIPAMEFWYWRFADAPRPEWLPPGWGVYRHTRRSDAWTRLTQNEQ